MSATVIASFALRLVSLAKVATEVAIVGTTTSMEMEDIAVPTQKASHHSPVPVGLQPMVASATGAAPTCCRRGRTRSRASCRRSTGPPTERR